MRKSLAALNTTDERPIISTKFPQKKLPYQNVLVKTLHYPFLEVTSHVERRSYVIPHHPSAFHKAGKNLLPI